jgi:hypothetical protein
MYVLLPNAFACILSTSAVTSSIIFNAAFRPREVPKLLVETT